MRPRDGGCSCFPVDQRRGDSRRDEFLKAADGAVVHAYVFIVQGSVDVYARPSQAAFASTRAPASPSASLSPAQRRRRAACSPLRCDCIFSLQTYFSSLLLTGNACAPPPQLDLPALPVSPIDLPLDRLAAALGAPGGPPPLFVGEVPALGDVVVVLRDAESVRAAFGFIFFRPA